MDDSIKEILEDGADGRLTNKNKAKAKEILANKKDTKPAAYELNGREYSSLDEIDAPYSQKLKWLESGKIKTL